MWGAAQLRPVPLRFMGLPDQLRIEEWLSFHESIGCRDPRRIRAPEESSHTVNGLPLGNPTASVGIQVRRRSWAPLRIAGRLSSARMTS